MQAADLDGGDGDAGLCASALAQQADVFLEQGALLVCIRILVRPPRPVRLHQAGSLSCGSLRMLSRVTTHQVCLVWLPMAQPAKFTRIQAALLSSTHYKLLACSM